MVKSFNTPNELCKFINENPNVLVVQIVEYSEPNTLENDKWCGCDHIIRLYYRLRSAK